MELVSYRDISTAYKQFRLALSFADSVGQVTSASIGYEKFSDNEIIQIDGIVGKTKTFSLRMEIGEKHDGNNENPESSNVKN